MITPVNRITLIETKSGKLSLKVDNQDGRSKTIHSVYDPVAEAKSVVETFRFGGKGILVVLGLGLGYHVAALGKRFPDAKIIVIEASPEIMDLAGEHGAVMPEGVTFIYGLSPENALAEITRIQIKEGLPSLSVFTLNPAVSAFEAYYRPILKALENTVSVKLWDRLRYSKFREETVKAVLIDPGYFLVSEVEKGLKELGHKVIRLPVSRVEEGNAVVSRMMETVLDFRPDFLLTMNHLGFDEDGVLSEFFKSIEMPVASWYVDSPRLIVHAFDKNVSPWMSLFLWDKSYMKDMKDMGFESVGYLPLGTDDSMFRPLPSGKHRKKLAGYSCDVSFVGNSMVEPVRECMEKVHPDLHPVIEETAEQVARSGAAPGDISDVIPEGRREKITGLTRKEKMDLEAAVLWKATLLYRLSCLQMMKEFNLSIYGDSAWKELLRHQNYQLLPPLNYYKELPYLYNACRINFNATSRQMSEAVNQRVFDVPACGSFVLTDHQKSLEELFDIGKEMISYRHKDEIPGLVR
ncbi:MAG: hypothetical protein C4581_12580, partial [Nitrospiraceae bacterium]